jgi:hypothetical protein
VCFFVCATRPAAYPIIYYIRKTSVRQTFLSTISYKSN